MCDSDKQHAAMLAFDSGPPRGIKTRPQPSSKSKFVRQVLRRMGFLADAFPSRAASRASSLPTTPSASSSSDSRTSQDFYYRGPDGSRGDGDSGASTATNSGASSLTAFSTTRDDCLGLPEAAATPAAAEAAPRAGLLSFLADYKLLGTLGHGSFSRVFRVQQRAASRRPGDLAVKLIQLSAEDPSDPGHFSTTRGDAEREIEIMQLLSGHERAVKLHDHYVDDASCVMVTDVMDGGDVLEILLEKRQLSEDEARDVLRGLLEFLQFSHSMGVVHRDVKPENLVLRRAGDFTSVRVADYGLAERLGPGQRLHKPAGTPMYMAPECLRVTNDPSSSGQQAAICAGLESDMWGCGVVLHMLLCGRAPFRSSRFRDLTHSICHGIWQFDERVWGAVSSEGRDLVQRLLEVDPRARLTAEQALQHPWMAGN